MDRIECLDTRTVRAVLQKGISGFRVCLPISANMVNNGLCGDDGDGRRTIFHSVHFASEIIRNSLELWRVKNIVQGELMSIVGVEMRCNTIYAVLKGRYI